MKNQEEWRMKMKIEEFIKNDSRKYKGIPLFVFLFNKIF